MKWHVGRTISGKMAILFHCSILSVYFNLSFGNLYTLFLKATSVHPITEQHGPNFLFIFYIIIWPPVMLWFFLSALNDVYRQIDMF